MNDCVATVRAVYEAVNAQDADALVGLYAEDVVVDVSESISPDRGVLRGRDEAERWWRDWLESWETWTWEAERTTEVEPDAVVVATRVRGRGTGSGIEVDARVGQLWRAAGGCVTYVKMFQSEEEALAAATSAARPLGGPGPGPDSSANG